MENLANELILLKSNLDSIKSINISELNLSKTMLVIVDMNNGFAKDGLLYSPRVNALINPIVDFTKALLNNVQRIIAFTDCHEPDSIELRSYPSHCLSNSIESDIIDELKVLDNIEILPKNSTNGFFAMDTKYFNDIDNVIVIGDCTDICIYQFATTTKSYFNQYNLDKRIIVPTNLVDTFDAPNHNAEIMNMVFLNSMIQNGIEVVKKINI